MEETNPGRFLKLDIYFFSLLTQITQKYQLHEASSYLLEKKGDVQDAFLVMLEVLYADIPSVAFLPCQRGMRCRQHDGLC